MLPDKGECAKHNYRDEHHILDWMSRRHVSTRLGKTGDAVILFRLCG